MKTGFWSFLLIIAFALIASLAGTSRANESRKECIDECKEGTKACFTVCEKRFPKGSKDGGVVKQCKKMCQASEAECVKDCK
ncbi:MAG TPA: hypothetical protein VM425_03515 [Myxococcota bacterium]|nr:hypothetical protein [Myxococcota bacterium]